MPVRLDGIIWYWGWVLIPVPLLPPDPIAIVQNIPNSPAEAGCDYIACIPAYDNTADKRRDRGRFDLLGLSETGWDLVGWAKNPDQNPTCLKAVKSAPPSSMLNRTGIGSANRFYVIYGRSVMSAQKLEARCSVSKGMRG